MDSTDGQDMNSPPGVSQSQEEQQAAQTEPVPIPQASPEMIELEERYNKLKSIAIKLKKKIAEQNSQIETLKEERSKFQTASKIQQEYDKALDEVERLKKVQSTLQKDLQATVEDNVRLKMNAAEANSQIQSLSSSHKVLREKLELFETNTENLTDIKAKVESLEKELQEAKDAKIDAQQEKRQLQILSLEVSDYEKKLQDVYGSLEIKKVENEKLNSELNRRDQTVKELEEVISNYKGSENNLLLAKGTLQADVARKTDKIAFLQEEVSKLNEKLNDKTSDIDKLTQDFDNAKLSFSNQSSDFLEKLKASEKMITSLELKISMLDENKRSRETQITNLKLEMQQLESDYFNYKTKAQAMLKIQKPLITNVDNDEMERLQKVAQDFNTEISMLKSELQLLKLENENLVLEKSELNSRVEQLKADSIEKDVQFNKKLQGLKLKFQEKDDIVVTQRDNMIMEQQRITSSFLAQIETMKQEYTNQIQSLRDQCEMLKSSALDLRDASTVSENKDNVQFNADISSDCLSRSNFKPIGGQSPPQSHSDTLSIFHSAFEKIPHSQPLTIETGGNFTYDQLKNIPRGEGEGSESVTSPSVFTPRMDHYNVSFEQLLSSSFDSVSKDSDMDQDKTVREAVQGELIRSQSQVNHLTSLLRESESNCDRLAQLSDALKEEIRRIERDKERQEHLKENTEYLKNVLIKFMTLSGEAERQRLIPVLKTMLRLTSEEVEKLEGVTKGKDSRLQVSGIGAGWSSYLPSWNNTNEK